MIEGHDCLGPATTIRRLFNRHISTWKSDKVWQRTYYICYYYNPLPSPIQPIHLVIPSCDKSPVVWCQASRCDPYVIVSIVDGNPLQDSKALKGPGELGKDWFGKVSRTGFVPCWRNKSWCHQRLTFCGVSKGKYAWQYKPIAFLIATIDWRQTIHAVANVNRKCHQHSQLNQRLNMVFYWRDLPYPQTYNVRPPR